LTRSILPPRPGAPSDDHPTIHPSAFIHPLANVETGAEIGARSKVWQFATVRAGARVGEDCVIAQGAFVDTDVVVGNRCKLENYASLHRGSRLAEEVFVGPGTTLTNDHWPRSTTETGGLKTEADWRCEGVRIEKRASLGAGVIVLPGVTIGSNSMVGAGAVVVRDVASSSLVVGNPARHVRTLSSSD
jgi:acetyltransferase-like isoleucine patch superfamily enzyme